MSHRMPMNFRFLTDWPLAMLICISLLTSIGAANGAIGDDYAAQARPVIGQYCLGCHSTAKHKGGLDLERFGALADCRKDVAPWQSVLEMLDQEEMPPKGKPQPTIEQSEALLAWVRGFLGDEAKARAGDPGYVPVRRLSNAEYDCTIRDLTGVDLRPTAEFPADGAAGEGFTNAAEGLTEISPPLLGKYLLAAREIAAHAVLLPDGFRFSETKTPRDWTNESLARLRAFYGQFTGDGGIPLEPYLAATLKYREALQAGRISAGEAAAREKLNAKYLQILWQTISSGDDQSLPLNEIRARWRKAAPADAGMLAADIKAWQSQLWKVMPVGSYRAGADSRQSAVNPISGEPQVLRLALQPGANDVRFFLSARNVIAGATNGQVNWNNPRLEAPGKPTLSLRDYPKFGPAYEIDFASLFGNTSDYLAAAARIAGDPALKVEAVAQGGNLNPALLARWMEILSFEPAERRRQDNFAAERLVPISTLLPLDVSYRSPEQPAISGWHGKDGDLPALLSNNSDTELHIPGLASPHQVDVHPSPTQFVAAVWESPIDGNIRVGAKITHVHPACGNGVAWWLEHRRGDRAGVLAEGAIELGQEAELQAKDLAIAKGDLLVLAIDAKNGDHSCDLTRINLAIAEDGGTSRSWDLAHDVADSVLQGNPHADAFGNANVWRFVKGPTRPVNGGSVNVPVIPDGSVLATWRAVAGDVGRKAEADRLAEQVQKLLAGAPPDDEKNADRVLYDHLAAVDGPLLHGVDLPHWALATTPQTAFGIPAARFGGFDAAGKETGDANVIAPVNSTIEVRLPAALARGRTFVVDAQVSASSTNAVGHKAPSPYPSPGVPVEGTRRGDGDAQKLAEMPAAPNLASACAVWFAVSTTPLAPDQRWDGKSTLAVSPAGDAGKQVVSGFDAFRRCFPLFTCFPGIIPVDEVVNLKMYHREDEPLVRLFLDDAQHQEIDRLWAEHRFIARQPAAENKYLPLFIGFVTQDNPKELVEYFESLRPAFAQRAEDFNRDWEAAGTTQLNALADFAARAYRRPLTDEQRASLMSFYQSQRARGVSHEDAFRATLVRVLIAPSFLFRVEHAPPGKTAAPVDDWELATRLSYFLWSSAPDAELRKGAAAGQLHDPALLDLQVRRMLRDDRVRSLAIEFGTQWIHVRSFDTSVEKNEKLYPAFDRDLRGQINEESILFFHDLFQQDRPVHAILDADYTYLNEPLAKFYGVPNISGPQWRKVDGVRKFGRGGILGLASVQASEAGASRTSPVLRGNWVVETLLGEKLPRPPPDVPKLPEEEGSNTSLTTRQLVEKHVQNESCAVCHVRIDPFGFAFERYDAIGRLREKESSGLPIDCRATLRDGTEFEGIDGLRNYLLTKKKDVFVRLFCRRLLGYALGRSVALSDQVLIDQMAAAMSNDNAPLSEAVQMIVQSPQFQCIRGANFVDADEQ
jgi:hypothetical protein